MSDGSKKYWVNVEDRAGDVAPPEAARAEFQELLPVGPDAPDAALRLSRRNFFKVLGISSAAVACSRAPVEKVIPYLIKPEEITPGVPLWYASTCGACSAGCGLLVKARDGRPIKIEGNKEHPLSLGGVCATGQASVLSLYDAARAQGPLSAGRPTTWQTQDAEIRVALERLGGEGRAIRLVAPGRLGPTAEAAMGQFLMRFPTAKRVRFDALAMDAITSAHRLTHGVQALPIYHADRARLMVSFGADFLGTWVSPVVLTRQYTAARDVSRGRAMLKHVQIESHMSLTGSNADAREVVAPWELRPLLSALARRLGIDTPATGSARSDLVERLGGDLASSPGETLVLCGTDDVASQVLTNAINERLGNYGRTLTLADAVPIPDAQPFGSLVDELRAGTVGAVVFVLVNPVYASSEGAALVPLLAQVPLTVATSDRLDETARAVKYLAPDHHFLESWGDEEPTRGLLSLRQPTVAPIADTRSFSESLLRWSGDQVSAYDFMRSRYARDVYPHAQPNSTSFQAFWDDTVQRGVLEINAAAAAAAVGPAYIPIAGASLAPPVEATGDMGLVLFAPVGMRDGAMGNNGWLLELPDPIAKTCWTNTAQLAPQTAARLGICDGDEVALGVKGTELRLPALVQPGTHERVVAVALGWGRTHVGPTGNGVGANAFALSGQKHVVVRKTGQHRALPRTQVHHSQEGRPLVHEIDLETFLRDPEQAVPKEHERAASMWPKHKYAGHRWGMTVDLSACTGCSACLVSCQAENNVPVVGADEVRRGREMHWIRIDRYYSGPLENPEVVVQPVMCQHCENAPCETVCPVLATVHSSEGLSQQVYNRCVGTRYCANNCPTKVRRFNWFEYRHDSARENLVLNPDVTVRSRGVMEKCSLCVQRLQEAKARAKAESRPLRDGDVQTACQQSCPAGAIVVGDLNDPRSRAAELTRDTRGYRLLAEIGIAPSLTYLAKIRNGGRAS